MHYNPGLQNSRYGMEQPVSNQYLQRYAAGEVADIESIRDVSCRNSWDYCLIIPCYAESLTDIQAATQLIDTHRILQIWVVNCPDQKSNEFTSITRECLKSALNASNPLWQEGNLYLRQFKAGPVLLVDRCSEGSQIPVRQGVGAARKTGADIALKLHLMKLIKSSWCCFTDADAILPSDYFHRLDCLSPDDVVAVFPHRHILQGDKLQKTMVGRYQKKLDHHVEGLKRAGSPYAFHTIGSTITCRFKAYEKVRGIPMRAAGEDFYFLNKLAKLTRISCLSGDPVLLSGRRSRRVPFGTGPAIDKAVNSNESESTICEYNPLIYELLEIWLSSLPEIWQERQLLPETLARLVNRLDRAYMKATGSADDAAGRWMEQFGIANALSEMLSKSNQSSIFERHFHCWFDGFRALKFIHWWRDQGLPDVPIEWMSEDHRR